MQADDGEALLCPCHDEGSCKTKLDVSRAVMSCCVATLAKAGAYACCRKASVQG